MPFEFKLALKYFRARRKSLARFTSFIAIIGITTGVASLIIANSLAHGFSDEMQDKILANTAHISILTNDGAEISNWREIKQNLEKIANIKYVEPTTYENAVLIGKESTSYAVLRVRGLSQTETANVETETIRLGEKLAVKTGLKPGDSSEIIIFGNQTETKRSQIIVKDTFQTGLYEYDASWVYLSPDNFAKITGKSKFTPTILSISVNDIYTADKTAGEINKMLGGNFKVIDWQQANQPLFAALSLERKVVLAIILLIVFIAALNITTTLALLVNERRLDIAILRTCGARTRSLILIFLLEGLSLGCIGIFSGVFFGLAGCFTGNYFKLISLSGEVYELEFIPFHPHFTNIILIVIIVFIICLTATVYPALKASRIKPLENLRTQ